VTVAAAGALAFGLAGPAVAQAATASAADQVPVVVRGTPGSGGAAQQAVEQFGGTVGRQLGVINGFSATVPVDRLAALRAVPGVAEVTADAGLTLSDADVTDQISQVGSMYTIATQDTGAQDLWERGDTGQGVDVALIDSGVASVDGLTASGKVVRGPDLTQDNGTALQGVDTYGHGTHMAGIIAGRDDAAPTSGPALASDTSDFVGMAPGARIVSIKVANREGVTDVSQAVAAIDWVIANGRRNGLNIRVLNMSFGTDGTQSYLLDPLTYAVEQAWRAGVTVVVAGGNNGNNRTRLNDPAYDPYVIAVGSDDTKGTADRSDDSVSTFSNFGDGNRNPDVIAPGDHVVSLRAPGTYLDSTFPAARIGSRLFRGSGTSQATAVVSGAAALLLSQRPDLTPDQVKALLTRTATAIPHAPAAGQGRGLVDLSAAAAAPTPTDATQHWALSTGLGSLDAARGSYQTTVQGLTVGGVLVNGGAALSTATGSVVGAVTGTLTGLLSGGSATPSGMSWSGMSWSGMSWSGMSWSGMSWSGMSWSGMSWSGMSWSGMSWS
jgi:serine protease AprX